MEDHYLDHLPFLKVAAQELLTGSELHPKEKLILENIVGGNLKSISQYEVAYKLSFNITNVRRDMMETTLPTNVQCTLVIFPWSWVGKSHKVRRDENPSVLLTKKFMYRAYKKQLHQRKHLYFKKKHKVLYPIKIKSFLGKS